FRNLGSDGVLIQSTENEASPAEDGITELDAIVVEGSVPRRQLELEAEPRSIRIFDEEELEQSGFESLTPALRTAPNVNITAETNPTGSQIAIRGISEQGNNSTTAPRSAFFQDGVPLNNSFGSQGTNPAIFDTEAVEVFLGPQTTRFSRASTAGAINVVTKKPVDRLEAEVTGQVGDRPEFDGSFVVNGPLLPSGKLLGRIVGFGGETTGFIEFASDAPSPPRIGNSFRGARASLRALPANNLTVDTSFSFTRTEFDTNSLATESDLSGGNFETFSQFFGGDTFDQLIARVGIDYVAPFGRFTSNTSFRRNVANQTLDTDFTPFNLSFSSFESLTDAITQELRFESTTMEIGQVPRTVAVNFGLGASFSGADVDETNVTGDDVFVLAGRALEVFGAFDSFLDVTGLPPGTSPKDLGQDGSRSFGASRQDVFNFNIYVDATWRPVPDLAINGGLRYSFDRIESNSFLNVVEGPLFSAFSEFGLPGFEEVDDLLPLTVGELSFANFSPSASITYDWSDDLTTFFSFSKASSVSSSNSTIPAKVSENPPGR
ncbi:MAG: TonB-dependent receptor, partial [Pseudomonadota bacterium]